jgi:Fe-S-cluster containining protein
MQMQEKTLAEKQDCRQCGKCCEKWGWDQKGIIEDIIPWITAGRRDILQHVGIRFFDGTRMTGRDLNPDDLPRIVRIDYWVSPEGRKLQYCPFFFRAGDGKVYCRIHGMKPKVCINFTPWIEAIRDYALNCPACREVVP